MESEHLSKDTGQKKEVSILHILNINLTHIGEYTCHSTNKKTIDFYKINLNVTMPITIVNHSSTVRSKSYNKISVYCLIEGYPIEEIIWYKNGEIINENILITDVNQTMKNTTLVLENVKKKDNGTYTCTAINSISNNSQDIKILILEAPQVSINVAKAIGRSKIYINWTVNDGNEPESLRYRIQYKTPSDSNWIFYSHEIEGRNRSYVLKEMKNDTEYIVRMTAINAEGESKYAVSDTVKTLSNDPVFIAEVKINGFTVSSITISWTEPPSDLAEYIHYYQLIAKANKSNETLEAISHASKENLYMFSPLNAATTYEFRVRACSEYTYECGPWSASVNGTTMDGMSGPPSNVTVDCKSDIINFIIVSWNVPTNTQGTITSYNVSIKLSQMISSTVMS